MDNSNNITTTLDRQFYHWLSLEGGTDELLSVSDDKSIKMTRLLKIDGDTDPETEEVFDISITSVNPNGDHAMFDRLLGRKIRVTIEVEGPQWAATTVTNDTTNVPRFFTC